MGQPTISLETCAACGNVYSAGEATAPEPAERVCPNCGVTAGGEPISSSASASSYLPPYYQQTLVRSALPEVKAREWVAVPAVGLMIWGGLVVGLGLAAMGIGIAAAVDGKDPVAAVIVCEGVALALAAMGTLIFLGGLNLGRLRRYRLVLTAVIVGMTLGILICLPIGLFAIWPLVLMFNPQVRQAFASSQPQPLG